MPTAEDFRRELFHMMANAQNSGRESIEISARELHARVSPSSERAFECQVCWHDSSSTVLNLCALRTARQLCCRYGAPNLSIDCCTQRSRERM